MITIQVTTPYPAYQEAAKALAQRLNLIYSDADSSGVDYWILVTPTGLAIEKTGETAKPLVIDFLSGKTNYRRLHTSLRRETLVRALGLKNHSRATLVDATAGLARDSFMLAALGFTVTLLERSGIIHAMLEDAFRRAEASPEIAPIIQRLPLIHTDAIQWMQNLAPENRPDIIYLDPMFPERTKSALVKKEMRYFHDIVGNDPDADKLLPVALACALKRVVVKRPRLAEHLAATPPSFSQEGTSSRFDVYLI
jgi:16S rRNA (guanine1516-N2)-methyltransferase